MIYYNIVYIIYIILWYNIIHIIHTHMALSENEMLPKIPWSVASLMAGCSMAPWRRTQWGREIGNGREIGTEPEMGGSSNWSSNFGWWYIGIQYLI